MAASYKVGTLALTTSDSGTKVVTGVGFQPKGIIFTSCCSGYTAASLGIMVGATSGSTANYSQMVSTSQGTTERNFFNQSNCITLNSSIGDGGGEYKISTFDSDGFTLTVVDAVNVDVTVNYIAFGGADVSIAAGTVDLPNSQTNFSVSGLGFNPNVLLLYGGHHNLTSVSYVWATSRLCMGFTDGTTSVAMGWANFEGADPQDLLAYTSTSKALVIFGDYHNIQRTVAFSSWNAGGFTLTAAGSNTNATMIGYVALKVPNVKVGTTVLQTGTGTWSQSGFSFQPEALLLASSCTATTTETNAAGANYTVGITDGTTNVGGNLIIPDNVTPKDAYAAVWTNSLLKGYERTGADTFSVESEVALSSFNSGGFTLNQVDAAPAAGIVGYIAFGDYSDGAMLFTNTTIRILES